MQADLIAAVGIGLNVVGVSAVSKSPPSAPPEPVFMVETLAEGSGLPAESGDLVTVHFVVRTAEGKELANTLKRGMPYTVELSEPQSFWAVAVEGLKADGRRRVRANSSQFFGRHGVSPIVPSDTWLEAELTVLKVQKATSAKKPDSDSRSGDR